MAKYTTEVRSICESLVGVTEGGYQSVNEVIAGAIKFIFDFDFPIYDVEYKNVLCTKILKHYYTREIGAETYGLWKLWLDRKLNEIMPYYNQLYKSAMIEFNPMYDVDLTTTHNRKNDGVSATENTSGNTSTGTMTRLDTHETIDSDLDAFSDTPQGGLSDVETLEYLTNARHIRRNRNYEGDSNVTDTTTGTRNDNGTTSTNTTEDYMQKIVGKNGGASYSTRLNEFRSTFINIDTMIIKELSDLFINLW